MWESNPPGPLVNQGKSGAAIFFPVSNSVSKIRLGLAKNDLVLLNLAKQT
jgi:hypothetical protein